LKREKKRLSRRWWFWAIIGVATYAVLSSVWIGVRGWEAKGELEAAQAQIGTLKQQALALEIEPAQQTLGAVQQHSARAASLTGDPIWRIAEFVPFLGPNLTAVRELAEVADDTVTGVADPLLSVATSIDPASLAPKDGAIDLAPIAAAGDAVRTANDNMIATLEKARSVPTTFTVGPVSDARSKVVGMLEEVAPTLATLDVLVPLLPPAMGSEGPRHYVLMFQNPAEPRALGGATLSLTSVTVDNGKISLGQTVPASTGAFPRYGESVIPIPDGAEEVYPYGEFGTFISEASARPSFTTAGQIVSTMWERQFGEKLDGVLSLDPVALSYMLRATGPIPISSGDTLDENTLVPLLLNGVYLRYGNLPAVQANMAHDAVYALVVQAVFGRLTGGALDATKLIGALQQGWSEHRILFWSSHEDEEALMAEVGLNGELPVTDDSTVRAGVYLQDSVGSKLSFYLRQSLQLSHAVCSDDGRTTYRVALRLQNTMDPAVAASLPFHITGEWAKVGTLPGVNRMTVRLYAPPGAQMGPVTINDGPATLPPMHDTDYPVGKAIVEIAPGGELTIVYYFTLDGNADRDFQALVTPLVTPTAIETTPLDCAAIPQQ